MSFKKRITCQQPITILVAGPNRTGFKYQNFSDESNKSFVGLLNGDPNRSSATLTIIGDQFGSVGIPAKSQITILGPVSAVTTITIGANVLSANNGPRTSGSDDFDITAVDVYQDICDAINDAANSFAVGFDAMYENGQLVVKTVGAGYSYNSTVITSSDESEISVTPFSGGGQTPGNSKIFIGEYTLVPGIDWEVVNGNANVSAANLAAAISRLPKYTANAILNVIDISGPTGDSFNTRFEAIQDGLVPNYELSPSDGKMLIVGQSISSVEII